jgi:hypothetical protein
MANKTRLVVWAALCARHFQVGPNERPPYRSTLLTSRLVRTKVRFLRHKAYSLLCRIRAGVAMRPAPMAFPVAFLLVTAGCSTTVNLTARNIDKVALQLRVVSYDNRGLNRSETEHGTLEPSQTRALPPFKVKNGGRFELVAALPGSAIVFREPRPVTGTPDPQNESMDVNVRMGRVLDDSVGLRTISDSFKKLGPSYNAYPLDIKAALATRFGGLLLFPAGDALDRAPLFTVTPKELGVKVVTLDDISFPSTVERDKTELSGSASTNAKLSVPLYGSLAGSVNTSSAYSIEWALRGFGVVPKPEDADKSLAVRFANLPQHTRDTIRQLLKDNPGSKLLYINNLYVVKSASVTTKEGTKLATNIDASGANVVTLSGAYSFANSSEATRQYDDFVLNYFGDEVSLLAPGTDTTATWKGPGDSDPIIARLKPTKSFIPSWKFNDLPKAKARDE